MPGVDNREMTHNGCRLCNQTICHCHWCSMKIIEERDKAQREAEDYRDELEEQKKEFDCVYKSASDRLKTILELQAEVNTLRKALANRGEWVSYEDHCVVSEKLQNERDEAQECARKYLPHVKYSYDDMNKGRAYEREQRAKYSWLGPPETPIDDVPD